MSKLLRRWDDWSDGQGFLWDGIAHGVAHSVGMIGGIGSLSPVAFGAEYTSKLDSGYIIRFGFRQDSSVYFLADNLTHTKIYKFDLSTSTFMNGQGSTQYSNTLPARPVRFEGKWLWTTLGLTDTMKELTTNGGGDISADTIVTGDGSSGGGHLINYGHQLAKISDASGISILSTNGNPVVDADWGSHFPVGDDSDTTTGAAAVQGRAYVQRGKGLYTFNARGRAGSVYEDFDAFQQENVTWWSMANWKGGLVFTREDAIYYWQPGTIPVNIAMAARGLPDDYDNLFAHNAIKYTGIQVIGDYVYVKYRYYLVGTNTGIGGVMVGQAKGGDPRNISWWNYTQDVVVNRTNNPVIVTGVPTGLIFDSSTILFSSDVTATSIFAYPLGYNGAPVPVSKERLAGVTIANSRVWFSYVDLHGIPVTSVRIHVDNMQGTVSAKPTTRQRIDVIGPLGTDVGNPPVLGHIYTNGTHEFNISTIRQSRDRFSIGLQHHPEITALQIMPPHIRSVELYGEEE